jgi:2-oxo-4-hydroxy-4-carboxy-5-ureidoimidazoline decarboxylase
MHVNDLNALPEEEAVGELLRCCGSRRWARSMARERPFGSATALAEAADRIWQSLSPSDWREAFAAHPRIGGPAGGMARHWSAEEQAKVWDDAGGDAGVRDRLAQANIEYEARFGYIFIVCATGKSGPEMLAILEGRLSNPVDKELTIAAAEQAKITRLRLEKLLR